MYHPTSVANNAKYFRITKMLCITFQVGQRITFPHGAHRALGKTPLGSASASIRSNTHHRNEFEREEELFPSTVRAINDCDFSTTLEATTRAHMKKKFEKYTFSTSCFSRMLNFGMKESSCLQHSNTGSVVANNVERLYLAQDGDEGSASIRVRLQPGLLQLPIQRHGLPVLKCCSAARNENVEGHDALQRA